MKTCARSALGHSIWKPGTWNERVSSVNCSHKMGLDFRIIPDSLHWRRPKENRPRTEKNVFFAGGKGTRFTYKDRYSRLVEMKIWKHACVANSVQWKQYHAKTDFINGHWTQKLVRKHQLKLACWLESSRFSAGSNTPASTTNNIFCQQWM